jgi:hypothetical protein
MQPAKLNGSGEYEAISVAAMTPEQQKLAWELINNPPPGSKLAEAKEYGIDLTLLVENLKLTPSQRARKAKAGAQSLGASRSAVVRRRAEQ